MLILSRRRGENVVMGEDEAVVTLERVTGAVGYLTVRVGTGQIKRRLAVGESLQVPGLDARVKLLSCAHGSARLGIAAPRSLAIHRQEIRDRIVAQREVRHA